MPVKDTFKPFKERTRLLAAPCILCATPTREPHGLCPGCFDDLPRLHSRCDCCALPLPPVDGAENLCGECLMSPPPFTRALAALSYEAPADFLIQSLKFREKLYVAPLLAELLREAVVAEYGDTPDLLVPVPLHRARLRERGFNQALEVSRHLARRLGVPLVQRGVRRTRATGRQSDLAAGERAANVRGAFAVDPGALSGHVAVVDDVMTTGKTAAEFARCLLRAGVERVDVWVCARAAKRRGPF